MNKTEVKYNSWWIAEISFRPGNLPHRCIANRVGWDHWEIHGNYEGVVSIFLPTFRNRGGEFALVRKIPEMKSIYKCKKLFMDTNGRAVVRDV